jgi:hypothetical protein
MPSLQQLEISKPLKRGRFAIRDQMKNPKEIQKLK